MRLSGILTLTAFLTGTAVAQVDVSFDNKTQRWTLSNSRIEASFDLSFDGPFRCAGFRDLQSQSTWRSPDWLPSSPIGIGTTAGRFDASTLFTLTRHSVRNTVRGGKRLTITLEDVLGRGTVRVDLELYPDQPVLRYRSRFTNWLARRLWVRSADMLPWSFEDGGSTFQTFRVNQWVRAGQWGNFDPIEEDVSTEGDGPEVQSGAHGQHCAWLVVSDSRRQGLFAGWEFDGRANASARHFGPASYLSLSAQILRLNHPLDQNDEFAVPWAFLGLYQGDWDEAAWRTQRFVEAALAQPVPDAENFPYVVWDSWRYKTDINEELLRANARLAAQLGIELFVIDLGWARQIGDWREDPQKFPSGLRALSDYVHSLGMKFGLHFPLAEAMEDAPVLAEHPDWTSSESYAYYDAKSLCLGHQPVRDWITQEAVRMIDEYNVDWIVQDGENMVKQCSKSSHTHDPLDSNYANSVEGINAVVGAIQNQRPNVLWENCEDGGNMMTFNMVRSYVTSIAADDSGPLTTRKAVYGATYPFSPRYADRYMPEESLDLYTTRSFLFGGPWIFMNKLPDVQPQDFTLAAREIQLYKSLRRSIREGRVYHLTSRPEEGAIDAIQSLHEASGSAVVIITRDGGQQATFQLRPRGLSPEVSYVVRFENSGRSDTLTGQQLMDGGIRVDLPESRTAEVVRFQPTESKP
jgi:alpha-galactosidase